MITVSQGMRGRLLEDAGDGQAKGFAGHSGGGEAQKEESSFLKLLGIGLALSPKFSLPVASAAVQGFKSFLLIF
jgi:hypothetical protein